MLRPPLQPPAKKPLGAALVAAARKRAAGGMVAKRLAAMRASAMARKLALFDNILENMSQGYCVYDDQLRLISFNARYVELLGFDPDFVRPGMMMSEVLRDLAWRGDFGDGDIDQIVADRLAFHGGAEKTLEFERVRANGIVLAICRRPMPGGGFITTFTDVTEQRRAQTALATQSALLETTLHHMPHGVAVYNANQELVMSNDVHRQLLDLPPGLAVPGRKFEEIVRHNAQRGDYGGNPEEEVRKRIASVSRLEHHRREFTRANGASVLIRRAPMPNGGFVITYVDISEQKRAEADLIYAKEQAEIANRSKSEFLANVSHELRTPLNAVIGFSEMMRDRMFGALGHHKYEEYALDINLSGRHLLSIIEDILDLSKIEAGRTDLHEEAIDIERAVANCVSIMRPRAEAAGVLIISNVPDELPRLRGETRKIKQILLNLMSNAVKFTPSGGRVILDVYQRGGEGDLVLRVRDNGIGIAPADIPLALSPFGQVENSLSRKHHGTGLGLPLSKAFTELHGGTLELDSEFGKGTTVTVILPPSRLIAA